MTASNLKIGQKAIIKRINEKHPSAKRLIEYGFTPGQEIHLIFSTLFNDPLTIQLRNSIIAVRKNEAECIEI